MDYLLRYTAAEGYIRAFFAKTTETAETARKNYDSTPVVTAAVGRTLTAAAIMGAMLKNEKDILTVTIKGSGPIGAIVATADFAGNVKGYAYEPFVDLPLNSVGKLDVSGAIGEGNLIVTKDMGLKEPVSGSVKLISGEIAEDFAQYYNASEQTPSCVALGVLVDRDLSVKRSGGFVVQLMPGAPEDIIGKLESNITSLKAITSMMEDGLNPEDIAELTLQGLEPVLHLKSGVRFKCGCSLDRAIGALRLMGAQEIQDILSNEKEAEIRCHFCNKQYTFNEDELINIMNSL